MENDIVEEDNDSYHNKPPIANLIRELDKLTPVLPAYIRFAGPEVRIASYVIDFLIIFTPMRIVLGPYAIQYPVLLVLASWLYYGLTGSSSAQASAGQKLLGLKMITDSGTKISFLRALGREIAFSFLFIGVLGILFNKQRQGWHDMLSGCYVVLDNGTGTSQNKTTEAPASGEEPADEIMPENNTGQPIN